MKFFTACVGTRISHSGTRMFSSGRKRSRWEMTASMQSASCAATLLWISAGKADTTRCSASAQRRGMDGGHDQVAGFRGAQGQPHRLRVAHFADHQHIGVFAQGINERLLEARRVAPDLALPDVGAARAEGVFDRAFNRDNVPRVGQVDFLDQRRQGRGFAGTGGAADQDQAVCGRDQFLEVGMQIELFDRGVKGAEQPDGEADAAGRFAGC